MDQRVVRDLLGLGEDAVASVARLRILLGQRAIHSWVEATGAPFRARELYFPDQLEASAAK